MPPFGLRFDHPPFRLSSAVYAALLTLAPRWAALGDALNKPPYKTPLQARVLAVRPRNALALDGAAAVLPADTQALQTSASLGIVIGLHALRV